MEPNEMPATEAVERYVPGSVDLDTEASRLVELAAAVGAKVKGVCARTLVTYLDMMLIKNNDLNLTAVRTWDKALVLHLVDSLTLLRDFDEVIPKAAERPFMDMGTGAGLPGIPLAIMRPARTGVLCDSVKKKVRAVDGFIDSLGLAKQLKTSYDRLEVLGKKRMRAFGCVVARALSSLPVIIEYAAPLLAKQGRLIVTKGQIAPDEEERGQRAAEICGLAVVSRRELDLPGDYGHRTIISYGKIAEPSITLPREVGVATSRPLA